MNLKFVAASVSHSVMIVHDSPVVSYCTSVPFRLAEPRVAITGATSRTSLASERKTNGKTSKAARALRVLEVEFESTRDAARIREEEKVSEKLDLLGKHPEELGGAVVILPCVVKVGVGCG
jgi:hypothetical protein